MSEQTQEAQGQGVAEGLPALAQLPEDRKTAIVERSREIDVKDSNAIMSFGQDSQKRLNDMNDQILDGVRNKDTGPVGEHLSSLMTTIRGLPIDEAKNGGEPGWFGKLLGKVAPIEKLINQYQTAEHQIDSIQKALTEHYEKMCVDVERLDRLYETTMDYFQKLEDDILAAEERLRQLDEDEIPSLKEKAEKSGDFTASQELQDMNEQRNRLERKIRNLKVTRQVVMNSIPSIRNSQSVDWNLAEKINSVKVDTIPIFKQQVAQALLLERQSEAADMVNDVTDATSQMIKDTATYGRETNRKSREAIERTNVDVDAVMYAREQLIGTLKDNVEIYEQAKQRNAEAQEKMREGERKLKDALQGKFETAEPEAA